MVVRRFTRLATAARRGHPTSQRPPGPPVNVLLSGIAQTIILVGHVGRTFVSKRRVSERLSRLRRGAGEGGVADRAAGSSSGGELRPLSHLDAMVRSCPDLFRGDELPLRQM